jgi:hypothetical protein
MALSHRDIVITPNRGASTEPLIRFTGADAASSATITLRVINSSTVGTLSFEGASGQLLSITDSMVGTIFSVNDVSGIPSIEVLDTGLIKLAQYNGSVSIGTTQLTTSKLEILGNAATAPALSLNATEAYSALPVNYIQFRHKYNSAGTYITGSSILVSKSNTVDGDTQTKFSVYTRQNGGSQTERFSIDGSTSTITGGLQVGSIIWTSGIASGEIRASNEITAYYSSDIRLKENIRLISDPITIVEQIRGVYFDWTDEHIAKRGGEDGYFVRKHDVGVIAQEVEAVLPELVAERDDGTKVVKYEKLVALLIEAIKEQQKQINQISQALEIMANK